MTTTTAITVPVNRLRLAVRLGARPPATAAGPGLPRALAGEPPVPAPPAPGAPPGAAAGRGHRQAAHPRAAAVRR